MWQYFYSSTFQILSCHFFSSFFSIELLKKRQINKNLRSDFEFVYNYVKLILNRDNFTLFFLPFSLKLGIGRENFTLSHHNEKEGKLVKYSPFLSIREELRRVWSGFLVGKFSSSFIFIFLIECKISYEINILKLRVKKKVNLFIIFNILFYTNI